MIAQIEPLATTHPERAQQMFFLGLALAQSGEVVFLQAGILHFRSLDEHCRTRKSTGVPASEDPQRREVLMIAQHVLNHLQ